MDQAASPAAKQQLAQARFPPPPLSELPLCLFLPVAEEARQRLAWHTEKGEGRQAHTGDTQRDAEGDNGMRCQAL
jgi:hypothetical protein